MEAGTQMWFPILDEAPEPAFAPVEDLASFETEADAINYSVDQIIRHRRGLTQMLLADEMKIAKSVLTRLRQGQIGMPMNKMIAFVQHTQSYALLQYYAMNLGLTLKRSEDEKADKERIRRLQQEVHDLKEMNLRYRRASGE